MTAADLDEIILRLDDLSTEITNWTAYKFSSNFLTPADGFQFTVGDPDLPQGLSGQIREGMKVSLLIAGRPTCTGRIDEWSINATREGGTQLTLSGRDILGDAIDSGINPRLRFTDQQTLEQVVETVFGDFGFDIFITDNTANRDLKSGNKYGEKVSKTTVTKKGKVTKSSGQPLKSYVEHRAKPYPHEGAYEFCQRLAKRNGLHIWATGDGLAIVLGKPDFNQTPIFTLVRTRGTGGGSLNNIIDGTVTKSRTNQPSCIVADGVGGNGELGKGRFKVVMVNDLIARISPDKLVTSVQKIVDDEKKRGAYILTQDDFPGVLRTEDFNPYEHARPVYLHDDESKDLEQLKNFVKREMATKQQQALQVHYEVAGHTQNGQTWTVDTIANVNDDVGNLHGNLWVMGVDFSKSRGQGTRTSLTLIRPYSMQF